MPDYESMTIEELTKENQRFMAEKAAIREEQKKLIAVRDRKEYEKKGLEPPVNEQVISGAGGIESKEKVDGLAKKPIQIYVISGDELNARILDKSLFKRIIEAVKNKIK